MMIPLDLDLGLLELALACCLLGQFFQALLGGFSEGSRARRAELTDQAAQQAELESSILLELAQSPNPKIQAMALAGLLSGSTTQAKGKKGLSGLGGFISEIQGNPFLGPLLQLTQTLVPGGAEGGAEGFVGPQGVTDPISPQTAAQAPQGTIDRIPGQSPVPQLPPFQPVPGGSGGLLGGGGGGGAPAQAPTTALPITPAQGAPGRLPIFRTEATEEAATTRARIQARAEAFREILPGVSDELISKAVIAAEGGGAAFGGAGSARTTFQSIGIVQGNQLPPGSVDFFQHPVEENSRYNAVQLPDLSFQFFPVEARASRQGVAFRDAALLMGFENPELVPQDRLQELQDRAEAILQGQGFSRSLGAGLGGIKADEAKLLEPEEALQLQTTFGITRGQAAQLGAIPLTTQQVNAGAASFAFERDIKTARELFEKSWPRVAQPETRRLALARLQRDQDPDFVTLQATLGRMGVTLAVVTQGSRPTDIDVQIFRDGFPNMRADNFSLINVPSSFESGLRLLEAAERIAASSRADLGILSIEERRRRSQAVGGPGGGPPPPPSADPNTRTFDQVTPGRAPGGVVPPP